MQLFCNMCSQMMLLRLIRLLKQHAKAAKQQAKAADKAKKQELMLAATLISTRGAQVATVYQHAALQVTVTKAC